MAFWTAAGLLTLLALIALALPLLRQPRDGHSPVDYDREVYHARIAEIDADLAIGRLSKEAAEAAKTEEGRRRVGLID